LRFARKQQNSVKQLSFNKKIFFKVRGRERRKRFYLMQALTMVSPLFLPPHSYG